MRLIARAFAVMLTCAALLAANVRLYLTDGTYHLVREYEVKSDRVRFYSVERGDWEEIPLDLVDLKKTGKLIAEREAEVKATREAERAERKAEREMEKEVASVPKETGPYWIQEGKPTPLKQAESKVTTNKRRSILKAMSPIPVVTGKATLEIDGMKSAFVVTVSRPEFYFRLNKEERFLIARCSLSKAHNRIVEKWTMVPVTKELIQEHDEMPTFKHQVGEGLYKLWPQKPLEPGEYAIIELTDGKGNSQIWDFSLQPGAGK